MNRHNSQIKAIRENWIVPMCRKIGYILFHKSYTEVTLGKLFPFLSHEEDPTWRDLYTLEKEDSGRSIYNVLCLHECNLWFSLHPWEDDSTEATTRTSQAPLVLFLSHLLPWRLLSGLGRTENQNTEVTEIHDKSHFTFPDLWFFKL